MDTLNSRKEQPSTPTTDVQDIAAREQPFPDDLGTLLARHDFLSGKCQFDEQQQRFLRSKSHLLAEKCELCPDKVPWFASFQFADKQKLFLFSTRVDHYNSSNHRSSVGSKSVFPDPSPRLFYTQA